MKRESWDVQDGFSPLVRWFDSAVRDALRISREWGLESVAVVLLRTIVGVRYYAVRNEQYAEDSDRYVIAFITAPALARGEALNS